MTERTRPTLRRKLALIPIALLVALIASPRR